MAGECVCSACLPNSGALAPPAASCMNSKAQRAAQGAEWRPPSRDHFCRLIGNARGQPSALSGSSAPGEPRRMSLRTALSDYGQQLAAEREALVARLCTALTGTQVRLPPAHARRRLCTAARPVRLVAEVA